MNLDPAQALFLTGPTAVGKSAVALELAARVNGEIISVDSMQVYQGLDLGTAKPSADERVRVPHHLLDVVPLHHPFSVADFVPLAEVAAADILRRGRRPVFCGGTGLYFKALLEGLGEAPASDPVLRASLEATPLTELLRELAERDPEAFARIDRANPRRVFRAVEVLRLSGRPLAGQRARWGEDRGAARTVDCRLFALARQPADLQARIEARVDAMFAAGLVAETRALLGRGLEANRIAMQAIGYRQVVEHLRGVRGLDETVELVKRKTRQYVRRQRTWLRHQLPVRWIEVPPEEAPALTAARLAQEG